MPAETTSAGPPMEARIARLESDVAHLRSDVADIKLDVRSLRDKMDDLNAKLSDKIDGVRNSIAGAKVWALLLYFALAGTMFGAMARGFGWI
jgi:hypothetical protein